jgi:cell wall-associated NlpC family hydrolase
MVIWQSWAYVDKVISVAARYGSDSGSTLITGSSTVAETVVSYARTQVGKAYKWGAEGPAAFDCSGLTMKAYAAARVTIPRTTFDQWPFGARVPAGLERPGDLVFFTTGPGASQGRPGHVGIVIGGGRMIEARCTRCGPIAITSYRNRPHLAGFTRPWAQW